MIKTADFCYLRKEITDQTIESQKTSELINKKEHKRAIPSSQSRMPHTTGERAPLHQSSYLIHNRERVKKEAPFFHTTPHLPPAEPNDRPLIITL